MRNFAVVFHTWCGFTRHIDITKRYARLANGNVRNFYEIQGQYDGSRIYSVDWFTASASQGTSHSLYWKTWYISATLSYYSST